MNQRWRPRKTAIIGKRMITAPAINRGHLTPCMSVKPDSATGNACMSRTLVITNGQRKLIQWFMKVNTACADFDDGTTTQRKI